MTYIISDASMKLYTLLDGEGTYWNNSERKKCMWLLSMVSIVQFSLKLY